MVKFFEELLETFYQANNDAVRSVIFEEMEEYAYSYRPDYTCYDMDMYVALYKCAKTSQQRKHVLEHIQSIIVDNAFQYYDELIQNFKDFIQMREFLNENDVEEFDAICKKALNFFEKQKEESEFEASAGQADFVPVVYPWEARKGLKEVAGIIVSTDMHNLESYHDARLVLEHGDLLAVSISHSFFFFVKCFTAYSIFFTSPLNIRWAYKGILYVYRVIKMYTKEFWDKVYEKQNGKPPRTEAEHQKNIISVVKKFLPENIEGKRILDYGCGEGSLGEELLKDGANVDFAEISSKMVEMIRQKLVYSNELSSVLGDDKLGKVKVFNVDSPKDLPVENETYDYVIAWTVLHHIDPKYRKEFLDRFGGFLKKDGEMIISGWDEIDEILKQDGFKGHVTGKSSYTINTLPEYVDKDKFEIEETGVSSEKLDIFDKPRVVRYYLIKKK